MVAAPAPPRCRDLAKQRGSTQTEASRGEEANYDLHNTSRTWLKDRDKNRDKNSLITTLVGSNEFYSRRGFLFVLGFRRQLSLKSR